MYARIDNSDQEYLPTPFQAILFIFYSWYVLSSYGISITCVCENARKRVLLITKIKEFTENYFLKINTCNLYVLLPKDTPLKIVYIAACFYS